MFASWELSSQSYYQTLYLLFLILCGLPSSKANVLCRCWRDRKGLQFSADSGNADIVSCQSVGRVANWTRRKLKARLRPKSEILRDSDS
jgi:hypothetical protein